MATKNKLWNCRANCSKKQAKRRVVVGLLLGEVIRTNELKADEERVKGLIEEMASAYEDPKEVIEFSKNKERMQHAQCCSGRTGC
ncbi:hypothetical protein ACLB1M_06570 [Escherichia coli]